MHTSYDRKMLILRNSYIYVLIFKTYMDVFVNCKKYEYIFLYFFLYKTIHINVTINYLKKKNVTINY